MFNISRTSLLEEAPPKRSSAPLTFPRLPNSWAKSWPSLTAQNFRAPESSFLAEEEWSPEKILNFSTK